MLQRQHSSSPPLESPSPASVSRASPAGPRPLSPPHFSLCEPGLLRLLLNSLLRATLRRQTTGPSCPALSSLHPARHPACCCRYACGPGLEAQTLPPPHQNFPGGWGNRSSSGICGMDTTVFLPEITRGTEAPALLPADLG